MGENVVVEALGRYYDLCARCGGLVLTVCTDGGYNVQRTGDPEVYSTVVTVFDSLPRRCSTHYAEARARRRATARERGSRRCAAAKAGSLRVYRPLGMMHPKRVLTAILFRGETFRWGCAESMRRFQCACWLLRAVSGVLSPDRNVPDS